MGRAACWLKSMPCTCCTPSGTGSDGFSTASVAPAGADEELAMGGCASVTMGSVAADEDEGEVEEGGSAYLGVGD